MVNAHPLLFSNQQQRLGNEKSFATNLNPKWDVLSRINQEIYFWKRKKKDKD